MKRWRRLQSLTVAGTEDASFLVGSLALLAGKWQFAVTACSVLTASVCQKYFRSLIECS